MMDIQTGYPESPMEQDDSAYPCKGCGQILEEGKAFELAGHRWHIDCFRCNTCGTLLDSDANLLLLGDGSLICNNCTYSCSACGNKIEDLAILTGDQAYCAGCFRCRNCKKKIENLRYARTSQGMFCMDCHDALMARRRKKGAKSSSRPKNANMLLDKSLPSLPPSLASQAAFSPDQDALSDSYSESTPIELPGSTPTGRNETLSSSSYRQRHSEVSQRSELEDTDNGFFIPMAFDPNPAPGPSPLRQPKFELDGSGSGRRSDSQNDYFGLRSGASSRNGSLAHIHSGDHSSAQSPHVAVQEQGWDHSQDTSHASQRKANSSAPDKKQQEGPRTSAQVDFQLQDAPKRKSVGSKDAVPEVKAETKDRLSPSGQSALREQHINITSNQQSPRTSSLSVPMATSPRLSTDSRGDENITIEIKPDLSAIPKRGDSLQKPSTSTAIPRKEVGSRATSSSLAHDSTTEPRPKVESEPKRSLDFPPRSRDRPSAALAGNDLLSSPQAAGQASPDGPGKHQAKSSVSSLRSDALRAEPGSPSLRRRSKVAEDDDHKGPGSDENDNSFLRRVSKSVRHARSHSDRANRNSKEVRWSKGAINGGSPLMEDTSRQLAPSPEGRDDLSWLRAQLRKERERNTEAANMAAELAALKSELADQRQKTKRMSEKNAELEDLVEGKNSIKQVNSELREKRSTMVVLDTQKEIVVRELEILTDHIAASKKSKEPLDFSSLSSSALRDFASSLQKLKDSYTPLIEELTEKKISLQEEVMRLSMSREKAQEEFQQLSQKNVQLMDLNNSMVSQGPSAPEHHPRSQGLGIYTHHHKDKSNLSIDSREMRPSLADSHYSGSTLGHEHDADGATILTAPRVVNIRKEQPKKTFNWKKGGTVAKGMTKGLKGAFSSSDSRTPREMSITEGMPYGTMPQNGELPTTLISAQRMNDQRQGFGGLFGQQKRMQQPSRGGYPNGMSLDEQPLHPSKLFGAELEQRAEWERVNIPSIVTRCIQEVELRGMDQEGIYRKSGGAAQIQVIRDGFVGNNEYDISDPDLDINAVTSCLKQYFRKLPTPLITYEVYDVMLDSIGTATDLERVQGIRAAVRELPSHHRDCLEFLVFHLARVIEREKENLMTAMNCAVVFAPTIMRPESITREMTDTAAKNTAVQFLIENCHAVFLGENGVV